MKEMLVSIVPIGNSKGIRLPKSVLDECEISDKLELKVQEKEIILTPVHKKTRENWANEFKNMAKEKDDSLIINDSIDLEMDNWEW
jgi:antitoxin MazE